MSFNINQTGTFNNGFVGVNSQKPIVGHIAKRAYLSNVYQAKNNGTDVIVAGTPLAITNNTGEADAGKGLNPNVFLATKATTSIDGFALASDTDIVSQEYQAGVALPTQIINVAPIGSGIETYLPVSSAATTLLAKAVSISSTLLTYDVTAGQEGLKIATDGKIKAIGNVVDGVKAKSDGSGFESCKVIKVRL